MVLVQGVERAAHSLVVGDLRAVRHGMQVFTAVDGRGAHIRMKPHMYAHHANITYQLSFADKGHKARVAVGRLILLVHELAV